MKNNKVRSAILYALLAAVFYGVSAPLSKMLLESISPALLAALLYLGAGLGMAIIVQLQKSTAGHTSQSSFQRSDTWYIIWMVVLDIAAPLLMMYGLRWSHPGNAALLNNFEIVATTIIAFVVFHEAISTRMWLAIGLITLSSFILSIEDSASLTFSFGSILVLMAAVCWGVENNCTRALSSRDPKKVVVIKGFGAGTGAMLVALLIGNQQGNAWAIVLALMLGSVAYGLSIALYIRAQRDLGAARTSAFYAVAPFIGSAVSFIVFREPVSALFSIALAVMLAGTYYATIDSSRGTETVQDECARNDDKSH